LKLAGVQRPQLFVNNGDRRHICLHDLRATFVTISLANGATERDVTRRTGHRSSQMLAKYDREVENHRDAKLGKLKPLVDAIPELAADEDE
jgi:integrase